MLIEKVTWCNATMVDVRDQGLYIRILPRTKGLKNEPSWYKWKLFGYGLVVSPVSTELEKDYQEYVKNATKALFEPQEALVEVAKLEPKPNYHMGTDSDNEDFE